MKLLILFLNLFFTLLGFLSIMVALTAPMLFDAPGSENNTYLWVMFWAALALPFTCFGSAIASWWSYRKTQNYKKSLLILSLPIINIAVIVTCLTLIDIYCQGSFSCLS